jgi:hypothetical protein
MALLYTIPLTKGKVATVDKKDYEYLRQWKWYCDACGYAARSAIIDGRKSRIIMHRVIAKTPEDMCTDHINMDRLDNRRKNLRVVNKSQNGMNRLAPKNSPFGYKGVSFRKDSKKFRAYGTQDKRKIHLGEYDNPVDAAKKYNEFAKRVYGQYANLNIITE